MTPAQKSRKSFVGECYNEPLKRADEHSRKLVSSSGEEKEATLNNERDRFGEGLGCKVTGYEAIHCIVIIGLVCVLWEFFFQKIPPALGAHILHISYPI